MKVLVTVVLLAFFAAPASAQHDALNRHVGVLACGGVSNTDQLWACAGEFTRRVGCDLSADYSMIRKTAGRQCSGWDCDKLVERVAPYRIYDLVGSAGIPSQSAVWNYTAHNGKASDLVSAADMGCGAVPTPNPTPTPTPTPTPQPVNLQPVLDALATLTAKVDAVAGMVDGMQERLTKAANESFNAASRASEIKSALEIKPCFAGSQSGWAGGRIRLCPE